MRSEIGQGAPLANKIVYQDIVLPWRDIAAKFRLPCQPGKSIGTRMCNDIRLHNAGVSSPTCLLADDIGQSLRYGIDARLLNRMSGNQDRIHACKYDGELFDDGERSRFGNKLVSSIRITDFGGVKC